MPVIPEITGRERKREGENNQEGGETFEGGEKKLGYCTCMVVWWCAVDKNKTLAFEVQRLTQWRDGEEDEKKKKIYCLQSGCLLVRTKEA